MINVDLEQLREVYREFHKSIHFIDARIELVENIYSKLTLFTIEMEQSLAEIRQVLKELYLQRDILTKLIYEMEKIVYSYQYTEQEIVEKA